ncbi:MAG: hypothetical protein KAS16_00785 [Thermoplasmata archaeon]|nr:hypothetical protein [Thermoplasmata archaeon]
MAKNEAKTVRVTITLDKATYDKIKKQSKKIGLKSSTWISMVSTATVNSIIKINVESTD